MKRSHVTIIAAACMVAVAVGAWVRITDAPDNRSNEADARHFRDSAYAHPTELGTSTSQARATLRPALPDGLPDTDGLGVAAFIEKLAPQARRGDVVAAMRVYRAEALCGTLELDAKILTQMTDEESRSAMAAWMVTGNELCAGVTPAQIRERLVFLDEAVRSGSPEALLAYRLEGPDGFAIDSLDPNDPRLVAWKQNANAYLRTLAAQGNYEAWSILSLDYQLGIVVPRDLRSSILYQTAMTTAVGSSRDPLSLNFVADMAKQLSAADVQQAIEQGRALGNQFPAKRRRV